MTAISPSYWTRGQGPTVLCLHCSASSSRQFEPLSEIISDRFRVLAFDPYGYGDTPMWQGAGAFSGSYPLISNPEGDNILSAIKLIPIVLPIARAASIWQNACATEPIILRSIENYLR